MLTNHQKKYLRGLANTLKPMVMIGHNGLTDAVLAEIEQTLGHHELLKIKIRVEDRNQKQHIVDSIIDHSNALFVQIVGGALILYRAFDKKPIIMLPKPKKYKK